MLGICVVVKRIKFTVYSVPPKKDGANSMWHKGSEHDHLKALRLAAYQAMMDQPLIESGAVLTIHVYTPVRTGDLDNFITGICDGLMAAHPNTPIDPQVWIDLPPGARPDQAIVYRDDICINKIIAERFEPGELGIRYEIEVEGELG